MVYNIDFLLAGLIFLLLILHYFASQNRMADTSSLIFGGLIVTELANIVFTIICTVLISQKDPEWTEAIKLALTVLYMLQLLLPYEVYLYVRSMRSRGCSVADHVYTMETIPLFVMQLLAIINYWTGWFFCFEDGRCIPGPLYQGLYVYTLIYLVALVGESVRYRRKLGRRKLTAIVQFLLLLLVCQAAQWYCRDVLLAGFGAVLGILVFYCTVNNPKEYLDNRTGVFDLSYFEELVQSMIERKKQFHLIVIDMFYMKRINRIYGNQVGNQILTETAQWLKEISPEHHVFRIKGNRSAVLTYSLTEYEQVRDQIQERFNGSFQRDGETIAFPVTICGIKNGEKLQGIDAIMQYIDYLAAIPKSRDESLLIQDDEKIMRGFRHAVEVEVFLKTAIEQDLFEVYYQPVYSIETGSYVTLEALSRLSHPKLGPLSPEIFIAIAEKNDQIARIGCLQFKRVCQFLTEHRELMEKIQNVKFNLSPAELMTSGHCEWILDTIRQFDLPYSWFQFEITETVATEYSENLYHAVRMFQDAGVGLCLDDFGSGYANLNTVLKLPFSAIKLDRSLLTGIQENEKNALFYRNIVSVLQNMGYRIISEGVELKSEKDLLASWGVDMIQGYYFSKPVNEREIVKLLMEKDHAEAAEIEGV